MIREIISQVNLPKYGYRVVRWHLNYLIYRKASPLGCNYYVTSVCNFRCGFCNIWRINPGWRVSREDGMKTMKELGEIGLIYLSISGGEPLVVPYTLDLLAHAKKCGVLYTHVVSNGFLMDKEKAKELAAADVSEISFSIDGSEEVHDEIRVKKGSYQKILEAIDNVKTYAPKTQIVLNSILFPTHPQDVLDTVAVARKKGVKIKVQPSNDHPTFEISGEVADKARRSEGEDQKQKLLDVINYLQKAPEVINSKAFLNNYLAFLFDPDKLIFSKQGCVYGYHHVEIFQNRLHPCLGGIGWGEGEDLKNSSVKATLESKEYYQHLRNIKDCSGCTENYYVCYYEPRLNFPLWNYVTSRFSSPNPSGTFQSKANTV